MYGAQGKPIRAMVVFAELEDILTMEKDILLQLEAALKHFIITTMIWKRLLLIDELAIQRK
jgi:hypothetical protein